MRCAPHLVDDAIILPFCQCKLMFFRRFLV
jgi:hypothetical protein